MSYNLNTTEDVLRAIKDEHIRMIDLWFTDLPGVWRKFSVPPSACNFEKCEFQNGNMLIVPEPASAFRDPFNEMPTLAMICNVSDLHDSRSVAQRAEGYLQKQQIGDTANFGVELEHFICVGEPSNKSPSAENYGINMAGSNLNGARRYQLPPAELLAPVRAQIIATLEKIGIEANPPLYEMSTEGPDRIHMRFTTLTRMADRVMICKHVVNHIVRQHGMIVVFRPKPSFSNNYAGMLVHQSIWQGDQPLFAGDGFGGSSALMRHYIAGLLEHALAVLAICGPMAVPIKFRYSAHNSTGCRIPIELATRKGIRVEFRCPDWSCNPYLAFAAMLMAGIDGFENRLYNSDPDDPIESFYQLHGQTRISLAVGSPGELLNGLEADHAFLLQGQVFSPEMIKRYVDSKRQLNEL
jgi:glutamine synthetase